MQFNYRDKYLCVILDVNVYVSKYEKCKFDSPFFSFQAKNKFIGKPKVCPITDFSGAGNKTDFDSNTFLLECGDNGYLFFSGL